jgi:hypothetical protein
MLVGYYFENKDAGSPEERQVFSQELFDKFDDHIVQALKAADPPIKDPSPRIRASIAVMAQNAPGSNKGVKARRAVQAYLEFKGS